MKTLNEKTFTVKTLKGNEAKITVKLVEICDSFVNDFTGKIEEYNQENTIEIIFECNGDIKKCILHQIECYTDQQIKDYANKIGTTSYLTCNRAIIMLPAEAMATIENAIEEIKEPKEENIEEQIEECKGYVANYFYKVSNCLAITDADTQLYNEAKEFLETHKQ